MSSDPLERGSSEKLEEGCAVDAGTRVEEKTNVFVVLLCCAHEVAEIRSQMRGSSVGSELF